MKRSRDRGRRSRLGLLKNSRAAGRAPRSRAWSANEFRREPMAAFPPSAVASDGGGGGSGDSGGETNSGNFAFIEFGCFSRDHLLAASVAKEFPRSSAVVHICGGSGGSGDLSALVVADEVNLQNLQIATLNNCPTAVCGGGGGRRRRRRRRRQPRRQPRQQRRRRRSNLPLLADGRRCSGAAAAVPIPADGPRDARRGAAALRARAAAGGAPAAPTRRCWRRCCRIGLFYCRAEDLRPHRQRVTIGGCPGT